jgi:hypothetical protein
MLVGQPQILWQEVFELLENNNNPQLLYTVPSNRSIHWVLSLYIQKADNASYTDEQDVWVFLLPSWVSIPSDWRKYQIAWYKIDQKKESRFQNHQISWLFMNSWDRVFINWFYVTVSATMTGSMYTNTVITAQNSFFTTVTPSISTSNASIANSLQTLAGCLCP